MKTRINELKKLAEKAWDSEGEILLSPEIFHKETKGDAANRKIADLEKKIDGYNEEMNKLGFRPHFYLDGKKHFTRWPIHGCATRAVLEPERRNYHIMDVSNEPFIEGFRDISDLEQVESGIELAAVPHAHM